MYGQMPLVQPNFGAFQSQREETSRGGLAPNLTGENLGDLMGPVAGRGGLHVQFFYINILIESADPTVNGTHQPRLCIAKAPKGDRLTVATRFISEEQAMREFPREFHAFRNSEEAPTDGTPIRELPGIAQSQLAMLMLYQIRSIEDLAAVPQERINSMGLEVITAQRIAKAWLRNKTENADLIETAKTDSAREAEMEALRRRLEAAERNTMQLEAQNKALMSIQQNLAPAQQPQPGQQFAPANNFMPMTPAGQGDVDDLPDTGMFSGGMVDSADDLNTNADPLGLKGGVE
jgi:hypothetical protein